MLLQDFEQCLFCLYGNPSKKSKVIVPIYNLLLCDLLRIISDEKSQKQPLEQANAEETELGNL